MENQNSGQEQNTTVEITENTNQKNTEPDKNNTADNTENNKAAKKSKSKKSDKKKRTTRYYIFESIRMVVMIAALCVFTYSSYELTNIYLDYQEGDDAYANMEDQFLVPNIEVSDAEEPETDMYGNKISAGTAVAEFSFDFYALLQVNSSAVGWIKQDNIISYPIIQGMDNTYYLSHNAAHQSNKSGAIFVDYRVEGGLEARNCIIYGHDMLNNSMFGSLIKYGSESYYQSHKTFDIYVGHDLYRYYVFAAYETDEVGYTYTYNFNTDEEFQAYIDDCMGRRLYGTDIGTNVSVNDKIITLSTCTRHDDTKRFIVQLVRGEKVEQ